VVSDTQLYSVFLIKGNSIDDAIFLFKFKQDPALRPHLGDSITNPLTFENFKIIRDEVNEDAKAQIRFTDQLDQRITEGGLIRIIEVAQDVNAVTHSYFVTRANNPNRISSYTTSRFADDQTLKQLFR